MRRGSLKRLSIKDRRINKRLDVGEISQQNLALLRKQVPAVQFRLKRSHPLLIDENKPPKMSESLAIQSDKTNRVVAYAGLGRHCAVGVRITVVIMIFSAGV